MRIFIYKTLLFLLIGVMTVGIAKTVDADDTVDCNYMPNIERFAICSVYNKWGYGNINSFKYIVNKESGWNPEAQNPHSTAYGLMQFLDSTWKLTSYEKTSDPKEQILAGIQYIELVYGTPNKAKQKHTRSNWY